MRFSSIRTTWRRASIPRAYASRTRPPWHRRPAWQSPDAPGAPDVVLPRALRLAPAEHELRALRASVRGVAVPPVDDLSSGLAAGWPDRADDHPARNRPGRSAQAPAGQVGVPPLDPRDPADLPAARAARPAARMGRWSARGPRVGGGRRVGASIHVDRSRRLSLSRLAGTRETSGGHQALPAAGDTIRRSGRGAGRRSAPTLPGRRRRARPAHGLRLVD